MRGALHPHRAPTHGTHLPMNSLSLFPIPVPKKRLHSSKARQALHDKPPTDELLVGEGPIDIRGIKEQRVRPRQPQRMRHRLQRVGVGGRVGHVMVAEEAAREALRAVLAVQRVMTGASHAQGGLLRGLCSG